MKVEVRGEGVSTLTHSQVHAWMVDQSKYFQSKADMLYKYLVGVDNAGIPIENSREFYRHEIELTLLDVFKSRAIAFELRLAKSRFPSVKGEIDDFWYFLEGLGHHLKSLVDMFTRVV